MQQRRGEQRAVPTGTGEQGDGGLGVGPRRIRQVDEERQVGVDPAGQRGVRTGRGQRPPGCLDRRTAGLVGTPRDHRAQQQRLRPDVAAKPFGHRLAAIRAPGWSPHPKRHRAAANSRWPRSASSSVG
ncbi:hypothetical protein [Verrucosispora sioxanthis]|uniref:hypothetical protein n=1 Tax=Verrucosispora sioxanthis TaxID=2499994 RepID=UPI001F44301C|nr:hypothetical protein [Verrucosispora sioxanthis]